MNILNYLGIESVKVSETTRPNVRFDIRYIELWIKGFSDFFEAKLYFNDQCVAFISTSSTSVNRPRLNGNSKLFFAYKEKAFFFKEDASANFQNFDLVIACLFNLPTQLNN